MIMHLLLAIVLSLPLVPLAPGTAVFGISLDELKFLVAMLPAGYCCAIVVRQFRTFGREKNWGLLAFSVAGVLGAALITGRAGVAPQYMLMVPVALLASMAGWKLRAGAAFALLLARTALQYLKPAADAQPRDPMLLMGAILAYLLIGTAVAHLRESALSQGLQSGVVLGALAGWPMLDLALDASLPGEARVMGAAGCLGAAVMLMMSLWPEEDKAGKKRKGNPSLAADRASRRQLASGSDGGGIDPETLDFFEPTFANSRHVPK